jgi:hypothetical protein
MSSRCWEDSDDEVVSSGGESVAAARPCELLAAGGDLETTSAGGA